MITFNDFVHKRDLKNKATSNIKIQQVLSSLPVNNIGIYLRDGPFKSDMGVVNLHPSKGNVVIKTKIILIVMVVLLLKNYLNLS